MINTGITGEPDYKEIYEKFKVYLDSINNNYKERALENGGNFILTTEEGFWVELIIQTFNDNLRAILIIRGINNTIAISYGHLLKLFKEHQEVQANYIDKKNHL